MENANKSDNRYFDVTIRNLFGLSLKNWRRIIIFAVIVALLLGARAALPFAKLVFNSQAREEYIAQNQEDIAFTENRISELTAKIEEKEHMLKTSVYYNLTSLSTKCGVMYYGVSIADSAQIKYINNPAYAYRALFESGEIYGEISEALSGEIEAYDLQLLTDTMFYTEDGSSYFALYIRGDDDEQIKRTMAAVDTAVRARYAQVSAETCAHAVSLISQSVTVYNNTQVITDRNNEDSSLTAQKTDLENTKLQLKVYRAAEFSAVNIIVTVLKNIVIGLVAGAFVSLAWYMVKIIFSDRIKSRRQIIDSFGLNLIAEYVGMPKNTKKLDTKLCDWIDEPCGVSSEDMSRLAASNISALAGTKNIFFIECKDAAKAGKLLKSISECECLKGYNFGLCKNLLTDYKSLEQLRQNEVSAVVVVKKDKTTLEELKAVMTMLENYKKELAGVILV